MLNDITKGANKRWEILGFSDCSGEDNLNTRLRTARASSIFNLLPLPAKKQVDSVRGEQVGACITGNRTKVQRSVNRAVLVLHKVTNVDIPPEKVPPSKWPKPKPKAPPTADCVKSERDALALAHPLALEMAARALAFLNEPSSRAKSALLKRYFGDDSVSTELRATVAYRRILGGLRSSVKYQCEHKSDTIPSRFCGATTHAYVWPIVGFRIHICEYGFKHGDKVLANTLVHEAAHMFAFEFFHPATDKIADFAEKVHSRLGPVR